MLSDIWIKTSNDGRADAKFLIALRILPTFIQTIMNDERQIRKKAPKSIGTYIPI